MCVCVCAWGGNTSTNTGISISISISRRGRMGPLSGPLDPLQQFVGTVCGALTACGVRGGGGVGTVVATTATVVGTARFASMDCSNSPTPWEPL